MQGPIWLAQGHGLRVFDPLPGKKTMTAKSHGAAVECWLSVCLQPAHLPCGFKVPKYPTNRKKGTESSHWRANDMKPKFKASGV